MREPSDALQAYLSGVAVLSHVGSRLNGNIWHVQMPSGGRAFLKSGTGQARNEVIRESSILDLLAGSLPLANVIDRHDDGIEAFVCTSEVAGVGLHERLDALGRNKCIDLIGTALRQLWSVPESITAHLPVGVEQELADLREVLKQQKIDRHLFALHSPLDPYEAFEPLVNSILQSSEHVLTHGDLCLPNIIVRDEEPRAVMIDWGKAGRGQKSRDMTSLRFSMERNMNSAAFHDLASLVSFDLQAEEERMTQYRMIDYYWYSVTSEQS